MSDIKKIGLVIADIQEYAPIDELCLKLGGTVTQSFGDKLSRMVISCGEKEYELYAVLCGIGKVNAAAATAYLIASGCDAVINSGLSGGISSVRRGDYTVGTSYVEHDFDVTPLGYKHAEKPDQNEYIYRPDDRLLSAYTSVSGIVPGVMVCGDSFVCSDEQRAALKEEFGAVSCDMESAAVASVCHKAGVPFIAVRRISDDAGNDAYASYTDMNSLAEDKLINVVLMGLHNL